MQKGPSDFTTIQHHRGFALCEDPLKGKWAQISVSFGADPYELGLLKIHCSSVEEEINYLSHLFVLFQYRHILCS